MQNWKKALIAGAVGGGTWLALSGRRKLGLASIAGGLALAANEYPERFQCLCEEAPGYANQAARIFATLSQVSQRCADELARHTPRPVPPASS